MNIDGHCLCEKVRYRAEIDPAQVFLCHCSDCQIQSGSAFRSVVRVSPGGFELTSGALKIYTKRAESGAERDLAFCPDCGTPIYGGPAGGGDGFLSLRLGTVRQRRTLAPRAQVWFRSAQPWLESLQALPVFERQPGMPPSDDS